MIEKNLIEQIKKEFEEKEKKESKENVSSLDKIIGKI